MVTCRHRSRHHLIPHRPVSYLLLQTVFRWNLLLSHNTYVTDRLQTDVHNTVAEAWPLVWLAKNLFPYLSILAVDLNVTLCVVGVTVIDHVTTVHSRCCTDKVSSWEVVCDTNTFSELPTANSVTLPSGWWLYHFVMVSVMPFCQLSSARRPLFRPGCQQNRSVSCTAVRAVVPYIWTTEEHVLWLW